MVRASMSISGDDPISCIKKAWWLDSSGPWQRTPATASPLASKPKKKREHAVALVELLQVQLALEAEVPVAALGLVEVELPQIGPLVGVVAFEPHARRAVDEACAIAIPPTDHVSH